MTDIKKEHKLAAGSEIAVALKKSALKSVFIVVAAIVFAILVSLLGYLSKSYIDLAEVLNHHACTTSGGFAMFALGISLVLLIPSTQPNIEKHWRFFTRAVNEMSGHLTLAGFGFASVFWLPHLYWQWQVIVLGICWVLCGWACILMGILFERAIETKEKTKIRAILAPYVLYLCSLIGVLILGWGVTFGLSIKSLPACNAYIH